MSRRQKAMNFGLSFASGLVMIATAGTAIAQPTFQSFPPPEPTPQFHRVEQPLGLKLAVTGSGLALIGLELWWFLFSQSPSKES